MTTSASEPSTETAPKETEAAPKEIETAPKEIEAAPRPRPGRLEWFWRGQALADAQRAMPELDRPQRELLLRARAALELGDRTLDPVDELKAGRGTALACTLYREAIYWALLAQDSTLSGVDLADVLAKVPRQTLLEAAGNETTLAEVEAAALKTSPQTWQDADEAQQAAARRLQAFAKALVRRSTEPEQKLARLLLQRAFRSSILAALVVFLVIGGVLLLRASGGPDLAAGRPWRASSSFATCNPKNRECGGARTVIFFCTQEEQNPWLEIDLGSAVEFSRVEVQNRTDCCDERAVPLSIEVSDDAKKWREVARKTELFSLWKADFPKVKARYVRTRALARTFLHLERVSVRR